MKVQVSERKRVIQPKISLKAHIGIQTMTGENRSFVFSGSQSDVVDFVIKTQDIYRTFHKKFNRFGGRKRVNMKQMYGVLCGSKSIVHYQIAAFLIDNQNTLENQEVVDFLKRENERLRTELENIRG